MAHTRKDRKKTEVNEQRNVQFHILRQSIRPLSRIVYMYIYVYISI